MSILILPAEIMLAVLLYLDYASWCQARLSNSCFAIDGDKDMMKRMQYKRKWRPICAKGSIFTLNAQLAKYGNHNLGTQSVMAAIKSNSFDVVKWACMHIDTDKWNLKGKNSSKLVFGRAVAYGRVDVVNYLLDTYGMPLLPTRLPKLVTMAIARNNVTMFKFLYLHFTEQNHNCDTSQFPFSMYFARFCISAAAFNHVAIAKFLDMGHVSKTEQFRRFGRRGGDGDGGKCDYVRVDMIDFCLSQNSVDVLDYIWHSSSIEWRQSNQTDIRNMRTRYAAGFTRRMVDWWQHQDSLVSLDRKRKNLL